MPTNDLPNGDFEIVLPANPSAELADLKARLEVLQKFLRPRRDDSRYRPLFDQLKAAAKLALDGPGGTPDPTAAQTELDKITAALPTLRIVTTNSDGILAIMLPGDATTQQTSLAEQFIPVLGKLNFGRDIPGYRPLLDRFKEIAQQAFDGTKDVVPNPDAALIRLQGVKDELKQLETRPGQFVIRLPDPKKEPALAREIVMDALRRGPVPPEQLEFKSAIEETLSILQIIFTEEAGFFKKERRATSPERFEEHRIKLYWLARVGLEGDADPKTATLALGNLRAEILAQEGPRIKNGYMRRLGLWAAASAIVFALVYLCMPAGPSTTPPKHPGLPEILFAFKNLLPLLVGTMIGTWLSFGIRKNVLTLRDLSNLEADMVEPKIRLIFTGLIAVAIAFIFSQGMVNVVIGGLNSANLISHGSTAFLIGILLGVSEQALPGALSQRATQFVSEIGKK